ncbi:Uncharacterised protein [Mycobacteroides abscessus subsp. abscessus]|nr:Uncharacterised protein [Mycobacteroides abscessus subsp. abscessus]
MTTPAATVSQIEPKLPTNVAANAGTMNSEYATGFSATSGAMRMPPRPATIEESVQLAKAIRSGDRPVR